MYLISISSTGDALGKESSEHNEELRNLKLLREEVRVAGFVVEVLCQNSVPLEKTLVTHKHSAQMCFLFGSQFSDDFEVPAGSWIEVKFEFGEDRLTVTRDPAGIMTAFIVQAINGYVVSDSIPLLFKHSILSKEIDFDAFREYWFLDYCIPPKTIWRAIRSVPNGFSAVCSLRNISEIRYSQYYTPGLSLHAAGQNDQDLPKMLRKIVIDSTARSIASFEGKPFVNLLSGGIDSSVVLAACNLLEKKPEYAITFRGDGPSDESDLATLTARHFGVPIEVASSEGTDIIGDTYSLMKMWGQPYGHGSVTAMQTLLKNMSGNVALLTGDGGGEAFKWRYRSNNIASYLGGAGFQLVLESLPIDIQILMYRVLGTKFYYGRGAFWWLEQASSKTDIQMFVNSQPINSFETKSCLRKGFRGEFGKSFLNMELTRVAALNNFNSDSLAARTILHSQSPEAVYAKTWRILDYSGVTGLAPLTSPRFLEAVKAISPEKRGGNKMALRQAFSDVLPADVVNAPKRGLTPINRRLLQEQSEHVIPWLLRKSYTVWDEIFDSRVIAEMWRAHAQGKVFRSNLLFKAIVFKCWAELWHPDFSTD